jgi:molybdate transport system substrate-binding protein
MRPGAGWLAVALLSAAAAGCGADGQQVRASAEGPLLILAASDLQHALPEIAADYTGRTGREVTIAFGSTGNLAMQIEQGAPADLFLAANEAFIERLERRGLVRPETRNVYAIGRLALAWADDVPPPDDLGALGAEVYRMVAIANPEHAPYGQAAREALASVGLWEELRSRLVYGENVSQAYHFVATGNAEAGIVALPVVTGIPGARFVPVDADLHAPLRQGGAVLRDAEDPQGAHDFLRFLVGPDGQAILATYGFEPPHR